MPARKNNKSRLATHPRNANNDKLTVRDTTTMPDMK